ncbi:MAG: hypothetical protein IPG45_24115 [Deltaproteobacteria bacterium]|jgi:hypothetical protein|nr:hypothetical protein [Deltaproteobacteria bacterium]
MHATIDRYRALVEADPRGLGARLVSALSEAGLATEPHPRCRHLTPLFLPADQYEEVCRASGEVWRALRQVADAVASSLPRQSTFRIHPRFVAALYLEKEREQPRYGRMDGLLDGHGVFRCIEYNPLPGAMWEVEAILRSFFQLPPVLAFSAEFNKVSLVEQLLHHLKKSDFEPGLIGVVTQDSARYPRDLDSIGAFLAAAGLSVICGRVADFERRDGRLWLGERPLTWLHADDWSFAYGLNVVHPIAQALQAGEVRYLNGCADSAFLAQKSLFAGISDPTLLPELQEALAEARRYVPWTRLLRPGPTQKDGLTVDLLDYARAHREQLVLKPSMGWGGDGVHLGWRTSPEDWQVALQTTLRVGGVLQERIHPPEVELIDLEGKQERRTHDLCPFVWAGGHVAGMMARTESQGGLHTVSLGGSCLPVIPVGPLPPGRVAPT